ncbi:MAG TPA: hypothetical protein VMM35_08015 [Longimicrobiales bacterium]|nr:hypothetical protein [Longimicrobiales bacterium]
MGGICQYCQGGYWDCGRGVLCSGGANVDEDRLHGLVVLGRVVDGCLQARLWLADTPLPTGWNRFAQNELYVRVQTYWGVDEEGKGVPQTRVFLPELGNHEPVECPEPSGQGGRSVAQ